MAQYILILIITNITGIYAANAIFGMNHPSFVLKYNHPGNISYIIKDAQTDNISSGRLGDISVDQFYLFKTYPNYDYIFTKIYGKSIFEPGKINLLSFLGKSIYLHLNENDYLYTNPIHFFANSTL